MITSHLYLCNPRSVGGPIQLMSFPKTQQRPILALGFFHKLSVCAAKHTSYESTTMVYIAGAFSKNVETRQSICTYTSLGGFRYFGIIVKPPEIGKCPVDPFHHGV